LRKLIMLSVAGLLAFATVAFALQENEYLVSGSVSPTNSGTAKAPKPSSLKFGFTVAEKDGKRPGLIKKYNIKFAGMQVNTNFFKGCSAAKLDQDQTDANCPKGSLMGTGNVENEAGQTSDESNRSLKCHLDLKLYNSRNNKAAIYLVGGPNDPRGPDKSCPLTINKAIDANFVRTRNGGVVSTSLVFTVDETLLHPAPGFDNAVVNVNTSVRKATVRKNGRTRGWFESVGACLNNKRAITVSFTPENGSPAQKAQKLTPCTK